MHQGQKKKTIQILKAEKDSSLDIPYQREGLYFSGSSRYRGLYSVKVQSNSRDGMKENVRRPTMSTMTCRHKIKTTKMKILYNQLT